MSLPEPQSTRSLPPNATWMKSLPARALIVSGAAVPMIVSLRLVPRGAAAAAVDTQTRASTSGGEAAHPAAQRTRGAARTRPQCGEACAR